MTGQKGERTNRRTDKDYPVYQTLQEFHSEYDIW